MNASMQEQIELTAILNLVPYLDIAIDCNDGVTLKDIVANYEYVLKDNEAFKVLSSALDQHPEYGEVVLVNQSSETTPDVWTDDLIQGCMFRDPEGNYYVAFRGTGDGRWADNGDGMTAEATAMQKEAQKYFDSMAEMYLVDAHADGKQIIVSGHSKGGNEAQYVYMTAEYEYLIDYCYSYDGQGFSRKACQNFEERYGTDLDEKLAHMYSICGENDYVHDLGYVIIPEENTYFVETSGDGLKNYHCLENMLGDTDGNYISLQWDIQNGEITHGEQGEFGRFAKKISKKMMTLPEEDLHDTCVAIMTFIDPYSNDDILGDVVVSWTDYVDLLAHGLPVIIETLLLTEEGHAFIRELVTKGLEALDEKYGVGGVIAGVIIASALVALFIKPIVLIVSGVIVLANLLDFVIDTAKALVSKIKEAWQKINEFFSDIRDIVLATINKIAAKIKSLSAGYKAANKNPIIQVDTYKLGVYAERLIEVNKRIASIDERLDSLYTKVGLLGLWNLIQADILTGYSWRLNRCASYLIDTATDFQNLENELVSLTN